MWHREEKSPLLFFGESNGHLGQADNMDKVQFAEARFGGITSGASSIMRKWSSEYFCFQCVVKNIAVIFWINAS